MSPEDATTLDHELKLSGRVEREHWIEQAKSLSEA
jgi:small subunit ribosomal protein S2